MIEITDLIDGYGRNEIRIVIAGDFFHSKIDVSNEMLVLGTWLLKIIYQI